MKKTIEVTIVIEVEATNQDVLDEGIFDLELDPKSNTEGFRIWNWRFKGLRDIDDESI